MPNCAIFKGFFINRPCENPSVTVCSQCLQPICAQHCAPPVEAGICVVCHAKAARPAAGSLPSTGGGGGGIGDPDWFYGHRGHYYETYNYIPIPWHLYHQRYFDEQDRSGLQNRDDGSQILNESEGQEEGLLDS